jgi:threonine synthase
MSAVQLVCSACGAVAPAGRPWECPERGRDAGDDRDHVLARDPAVAPRGGESPGSDDNPYQVYRERFYSYHVARAAGWSDERYVELVRRLDEAVAEVDGRGFSVTPLATDAALAAAVGLRAESGGALWVKDETGGVTGTHKARHLFQALVHIELLAALGLGGVGRDTELAIASCGNAALAAATLARAAGRPLRVFIPTTAGGAVVERLQALGARLVVSERRPGEVGDPCYLRFREAVGAGAVPFSCQGPDNAFAVEGGTSLGYELTAGLREARVALDALVLQVGGGAFASACITALREGVARGELTAMPRVFAVQTAAAHPLKRAVDGYRALCLEHGNAGAMEYAAHHRSELMRPWPDEPRSVAHGILDDETYDWRVIADAVVTTGGGLILAPEETLHEANAVARSTRGVPYCHTGTSGLAGVLRAVGTGLIDPSRRVGVVLTGLER